MQVSPVVKKRIYLPKLVPLCPLMRSHAPSPQLLPKSVIPNTAIGDVTPPTSIRTSKSPKSLRRNFFFLASFAVSFPAFAVMATVFFYPHIFTGSVGRRILLVVPVNTLYRISIWTPSPNWTPSTGSQCEHPLLLDCSASEPLRKYIFGSSLSILDLWSRPWGVARLLGLRGVPPRPHPSEGVG